jgi:hypothetical protein
MSRWVITIVLASALLLTGCGDKRDAFGKCKLQALTIFAHTASSDDTINKTGELIEACMLKNGYALNVHIAECERSAPWTVDGKITMFLSQGEPVCYSPLSGHWWLSK